jgi:integrase/recombinase XerD
MPRQGALCPPERLDAGYEEASMKETTLTLAAAARMMRNALRDRSCRATPLGLEIARYYRWKKNEWGATAETLRD